MVFSINSKDETIKLSHCNWDSFVTEVFVCAFSFMKKNNIVYKVKTLYKDLFFHQLPYC